MLLPFWLFRERILIKRFLYLGGKARGGMNILYNSYICGRFKNPSYGTINTIESKRHMIPHMT